MYCLVKQSITLAKSFCQYGLNNFHFLCQLNQSFKLSGFLFKMAPGNKSFEESQLLCFVCLLLFKFPRHAVFSAAINNIFRRFQIVIILILKVCSQRRIHFIYKGHPAQTFCVNIVFAHPKAKVFTRDHQALLKHKLEFQGTCTCTATCTCLDYNAFLPCSKRKTLSDNPITISLIP